MSTDLNPAPGPETATRLEVMAAFLANDLADGEIVQIGAAMPVPDDREKIEEFL